MTVGEELTQFNTENEKTNKQTNKQTNKIVLLF